jgi:hypothetical protein
MMDDLMYVSLVTNGKVKLDRQTTADADSLQQCLVEPCCLIAMRTPYCRALSPSEAQKSKRPARSGPGGAPAPQV